MESAGREAGSRVARRAAGQQSEEVAQREPAAVRVAQPRGAEAGPQRRERHHLPCVEGSPAMEGGDGSMRKVRLGGDELVGGVEQR